MDTSRSNFTLTQRRSTTPEFKACVGQIAVLGNLLKSISFTNKVNVIVIPRGLRFTVEEGKYIQASVTIHRDIFDEFIIASESEDTDISFKIPFKELLDCLKFFCADGRSETFFSASATTTPATNSSSLKLLYMGFGNPLQLLLDENGIITDFQIKTEPFDDDLMDFETDAGTISCKLILVAEQMNDLMSEFESNNPGTIRFGIIPDEELRLTSDGIAGIMSASIPYNSEMVQLFECLSELHVTYKFSILRHSFRAMNMSQTMSIKIDSNGVLRLTYLMATKTDSFVEFICLPNSVDQEEFQLQPE